MKISTILDQTNEGAFALPVFQKGYVWNREQVRGLIESLYRRHPVGSLLERQDKRLLMGGFTSSQVGKRIGGMRDGQKTKKGGKR